MRETVDTDAQNPAHRATGGGWSEWKCGEFPAKEEDITRQMAEGMCEGAKEVKDDASGIVAHFRAEAACAKQHPDDCAAYKACSDAAR